MRIQGSIGENLCFLVENHLKMQEDSDVGEFLKKKSDDIEQELVKLCVSLIPKIPIAKLEAQLEERPQGEIDEAYSISLLVKSATNNFPYNHALELSSLCLGR